MPLIKEKPCCYVAAAALTDAASAAYQGPVMQSLAWWTDCTARVTVSFTGIENTSLQQPRVLFMAHYRCGYRRGDMDQDPGLHPPTALTTPANQSASLRSKRPCGLVYATALSLATVPSTGTPLAASKAYVWSFCCDLAVRDATLGAEKPSGCQACTDGPFSRTLSGAVGPPCHVLWPPRAHPPTR